MMAERKKEKKGEKSRFASVTFGAISVAVFFLIIKNSELAIDYMDRGMKLCINTVIPSLFPFMVVSELIVASGIADLAGRLFGRSFHFLFGISANGVSSYLLGTVCGFPMGCRSALSLYKMGKISLAELSRLICFSNNPSSAFLVSVVGATLFGCREFGVALWCITLIGSFIMGVLHKLIFGNTEFEDTDTEAKKCCVNRDIHGKNGNVASFSSAVTSAANAMLGVCAFVIFFSVFLGLTDSVLDSIGASQGVSAWIFSFFELTGGVASAAAVKPILLAALITAFAVGWSGISVHLQVASFCEGVKINFGRYLMSKFIQGVLNVFMVYLYLSFFGDGLVFNTKSVATFDSIAKGGGELCIFISSVFFALVFMNFFSWVRNISSPKVTR